MYYDIAEDYIISHVHKNVFFDHSLISFQINYCFEENIQMDYNRRL